MVFVNEKQRAIIVVNSDGSLDRKIDFKPYVPHDITYIPKDNTIAITSISSHYIKIIDEDKLRVLKILCVGSNCAGIAYTNGRLIVCGLEKGLIEVNYPGDSVKTIISCTMSTNSYVATLGDKIFYTDLDFGGVFCCDLKGNILWTFPCKNIKSHSGVTADNNGNVFVADFSRNKVFVISSNGQQHRDLLTSVNAVQNPICLIYDRDNKQLLVTKNHKGEDI
ncbi:unnamed protein product [Mytilus coruscus]|uniref:TRIM2_3 n=1 Tax=Mytilus coruscus TaxID=42192 RepID=A0A6J8EV28_MYTCO|nr:unnamed protein product [Mytilus coruscus]